jgi:hypothetical protein
MVSALRVLSILTLAIFIGAGSALAVGYERLQAPDKVITKDHTSAPMTPTLWGAAKEATMVEKIPAALDQAAALVKDILSQFGVGDKKLP